MISKHNLTILKRLAEEVLDHANQPMNNLPYMKRDVRAAIDEAQHYIDHAYLTETPSPLPKFKNAAYAFVAGHLSSETWQIDTDE